MANSLVLELARRQFGVMSRRQLVGDLDLSSSSISRLMARREMHQVLPSVYRLASAPDTFLSRAISVQLWTAGEGFVSSWSAGRILGLRRMPHERIHFTVPSGFSRRSPDWIHLDRSRWYHPVRDRQTLSTGLVVATPLRMLFGLAHDFNHRRFTQAAEDAWHLGLTDPSEMADYLEEHRCRGKNGVATMERWLDGVESRSRPTQSHLERDVIEALERVGLPTPSLQHPLRLANGEVVHLDIAWPTLRLAVEPGSSWFHGGDAAQARDHDRDLACNEVGWMTIRLDESFQFDPALAAVRVRRAYRSRQRDLSDFVPAGTGDDAA